MGISAARLFDRCSGTCFHPAHENPIVVGASIVGGSPNVNVNGLPAARLGDPVVTDCGHSASIVGGDTSVNVNGLPAARLGDPVSGDFVGAISSTSPNTTV